MKTFLFMMLLDGQLQGIWLRAIATGLLRPRQDGNDWATLWSYWLSGSRRSLAGGPSILFNTSIASNLPGSQVKAILENEMHLCYGPENNWACKWKLIDSYQICTASSHCGLELSVHTPPQVMYRPTLLPGLSIAKRRIKTATITMGQKEKRTCCVLIRQNVHV